MELRDNIELRHSKNAGAFSPRFSLQHSRKPDREHVSAPAPLPKPVEAVGYSRGTRGRSPAACCRARQPFTSPRTRMAFDTRWAQSATRSRHRI
jgi:hypothetical protein